MPHIKQTIFHFSKKVQKYFSTSRNWTCCALTHLRGPSVQVISYDWGGSYVTNIRYLSGFRAANFLAKFFILRPQKSTKNVTPKTQYFCFLFLKVSSCLFHARASPDELCDCLYRIHRHHFREFSTSVCQKWSIFEVFLELFSLWFKSLYKAFPEVHYGQNKGKTPKNPDFWNYHVWRAFWQGKTSLEALLAR